MKILSALEIKMRYLLGLFLSLLFLVFSTTALVLPMAEGAEESRTLLAKNPADEAMTALFNGKDLSGWKQHGKARWEVKEGILIGSQGPKGEAGDLLTLASYDDFELAVTFRMKWPGNSGVWFRYQAAKKSYQADILEHKDPIAYSGSLYCPGKFFLATNTNRETIDRSGWNKLVIRAQGDRLLITINEKKVADVREDSFTEGRVGLQVHQGDVFTGMQIMVKEFKLRPL